MVDVAVDADALAGFGRVSLRILHERLTIDGLTLPSDNWRTPCTSSLGTLEALPLELIEAILTLLDFKTLSHVSRTCLRGRQVVSALREYRDVMRHAPTALVALAKTRLIHHFVATDIHRALLSANCTSCKTLGLFLHLPTCQRYCLSCISEDEDLWMIPISLAMRHFGLSAAELKTLTVVYGQRVHWSNEQFESHRLVCYRSAKNLATARGRSVESIRPQKQAKM